MWEHRKALPIGICPEAHIGLFLRSGEGQENSQERGLMCPGDSMLESFRRAAAVWGLYGQVLTYLLLEVRFYEYAKKAGSKWLKNLLV